MQESISRKSELQESANCKSNSESQELKAIKETHEYFEAVDSEKKKWQTELMFLGTYTRKGQLKRSSSVKRAQDILISLKSMIDNLKSIEEYEEEEHWLEEIFSNLKEVEWKHAKEEVSEILYKWGRFLLDNGKTREGVEKFWELHEKFPQSRWNQQVLDELVELEKPDNMIFICGGRCNLGQEGKEVILKPYFLDTYPVTNEQYFEFIKKTGYPTPFHWTFNIYPIGKGNHPVTAISAEDAAAYCNWKGYRLPQEIEWENAAKGPNESIWPWGNLYESKRCNCRESGIGDTTAVGSYPAGASYYKCYDLAGNVWEWTDSWYDSNCGHKVLRGGSWFTFEEYTTNYYRNFDFVDSHKTIYGFRCCKTFARTII